MNTKTKYLRHERGATLIVALIILAVMTILGVSNMRSSSLQMKMSSYSEEREQVFQIADSTLSIIEDRYQNAQHDVNDVQDCAPNDADCYDLECAGGLCFNGTYSAGDSAGDCQLDLSSPPTYQSYWKDPTLNVWQDASKHRVESSVGAFGYPDPKYIIEFLCYVHADFLMATCASGSSTNCVPLYRFTVFAEGRDSNARVMLQSTVKFEN